MTNLEKRTGGYYLWISEKGKNTCEKCHSLDGKKFYSEKEIPDKPHPNCKCEVIFVENKINNKFENEKCNCKERLGIIQKNIEDKILNLKKMLNDILNENIELKINDKSIKNLYENLYYQKDNFGKEFRKHSSARKNNKNNLYEEISKMIIDFKELENKNKESQEKLCEIKNEIQDFEKNLKDFLIDIRFLKEHTQGFHPKKECAIINDLKKYENKINVFQNEFENYTRRISDIKIKRTNACKAVISTNEYLKSIGKKEKFLFGNDNETEPNKNNSGNVFLEELFNGEAKLSVENLSNAIHNFNTAKKNEHAFILNSANELYNKNLQKELKKIKIPENSKGIVYNDKSDESRKIFKTRTLQEFIFENYNEIKNNKQVEVYDIEFDTKKDPDIYLALQHCKLYNPHITRDGYFEAIIFDYYDFSHRKYSRIGKREDILKNINVAINNLGFLIQEKGMLKNYFIVYFIKEKFR